MNSVYLQMNSAWPKCRQDSGAAAAWTEQLGNQTGQCALHAIQYQGRIQGGRARGEDARSWALREKEPPQPKICFCFESQFFYQYRKKIRNLDSQTWNNFKLKHITFIQENCLKLRDISINFYIQERQRSDITVQTKKSCKICGPWTVAPLLNYS